MKHKQPFFFIGIVLLGALQVTVFDSVRVFNVKPDLFLLGAVSSALLLEAPWAMSLSAFAGAYKGILGSSGAGQSSILFVLWSFLIIQLSRKMTLERTLIRVILVFVVALLHAAVTRLIAFFGGSSISFGITVRVMFLEPVYTASLMPLLMRGADALMAAWARRQEEPI